MEKREGYRLKERLHFDSLAATSGEIWWGSTTPAGIKRLQRRACLIAGELARFNDPHVLELGSGTGALSKFVLEELPRLHLTGCDISPEAIRVAAERYVRYKNASFEVVDVTSMPYAEATFDAVIGNAVLHHLPLESSLHQCLRVLKPGGLIWFSEPNMINPEVAIERNIRFIGKMLQNTEDETAFIRWSLAKTLQRVGFQQVSIEPFDFLHPIVPRSLMNLVDSIGRLVERTPFLREISGSLLIRAVKDNPHARYYCLPRIGHA